MGTQVQVENYMPGHFSKMDLSRESNGAVGWPSCYNDVNLPNAQFYYGFLPRSVADSHTGYGNGVVKQTMLEHEAMFKDQVCELHRLYRVQRELMNEVRRKDQFGRHLSYETSSSSSHMPTRMPSENGQKCNGSSYLFATPVFGRPLISNSHNVQSPPNSVKGKSIQDPRPFQNCYSQKDSESRPTKFRKRILDLELSADEYIDTDEVEQFSRERDFVNISSSPDENRKLAFGNGDMLKSKTLASLNEPLYVREPTTFSSVDLLSQAGSHSDVLYRDLSARLVSSSKGTPQNSKNGWLNATLNNFQDARSIGQIGFSYAFESEQRKASARFTKQGILQEKAFVPSPPVYSLLDQACRPGLLGPSDLGHSCAQYPTSRAQPNCPSQKPTPVNPSPFHSSSESNDLFGYKGNLKCILGANAAFVGEPPLRNEFSQASSTAFNGPTPHHPAAGLDYANFRSNKTNNPFVNPVKEMNLNVALQNGISDNNTESQGLQITDKDCTPDNPSAALPWYRGKVAINGSGHLRNGFNLSESVLSQNPFVGSSSCEANINAKETERSLKILGVSIFDNPQIKKESHQLSGYEEIEEIECTKRKGLFDMNIPFEASDSEQDEIAADEHMVSETKEIVNNFDLNSCITEEETLCGTSLVYNCSSDKVRTGIDLEALVNLKNEDVTLAIENSLMKESEMNDEDFELIKSAASAIVAISAFVDSTQASIGAQGGDDDPLHWFVSIACSSGNDVGLHHELDDYECMILRQEECTPEEYFPKPSTPDFLFIEKSTCALTKTRTRNGRRGRQKRDFQRDILPGLTTLSRHEVTEDLRAFGGLLGPVARNGRGRGRRRYVEQTAVAINAICALSGKQVHNKNVEVSVQDRKLTSWGKTTRRPRGQRFPAGNPALPVPLT